MDPLTPLDTLCRIILRAREYEAQTPTDYDGNETADNVDDEDEGTLSVLPNPGGKGCCVSVAFRAADNTAPDSRQLGVSVGPATAPEDQSAV